MVAAFKKKNTLEQTGFALVDSGFTHCNRLYTEQWGHDNGVTRQWGHPLAVLSQEHKQNTRHSAIK
jgi:hypothetical protein